MVNSRNKGAAFERKIVNLVNDKLAELGIQDRVKRNLDQYQTKGEADIYLRNLAIECKCYSGDHINFAKGSWWDQVCQAAGNSHTPVLVYKYNTGKIKYVIPAYAICADEKMPKNNNTVMFGDFDDFLESLSVILGGC
jgi:hypothetical protein